jgi:hypothetical protein
MPLIGFFGIEHGKAQSMNKQYTLLQRCFVGYISDNQYRII